MEEQLFNKALTRECIHCERFKVQISKYVASLLHAVKLNALPSKSKTVPGNKDISRVRTD
eukprot:705313-Karenia_brevis.AAC.1